MEFCSCKDWLEVSINNPDIFKEDPTYGWVLSWIEIDKETSPATVHRYGLKIHFCPLCGNKLP